MRLLCIKNKFNFLTEYYLTDINEDDIEYCIKDITGEYEVHKEGFDENIKSIMTNMLIAYQSTYIFKLKNGSLLYVARKLDEHYINWLMCEVSTENWEC